MALKFKLKSRDEVPAELSSHYVERDGGWVLDVDGAVEKAKVEEFRTTNVALMRERDELKRRFERSESDQVQAIAQERDALTSRLSAIQIDQAIVTEATKRGLRASAIPDITSRARSTFRLVNGFPQAFEPDGQTARAGRDGVSPMNLAEWIDQQVSEAPHLFESNAGGGAVGNAPGGGGSARSNVKNPFRKETWNITEQMRLQKNDPGLAARHRSATSRCAISGAAPEFQAFVQGGKAFGIGHDVRKIGQ